LFCALAVSLFGVQSVVANAGSFELAWPAVPLPIAAEVGRAVHLNLAINWPIYGLIGASYSLTRMPVTARIVKVAFAQLFLAVVNFAGIVASLLLGRFGGGEYLEAPWPFKVGLLAILLIWFGVTAKCYKWGKRHDRQSAVTAFVVAAGVLLSALLLVPNILPVGPVQAVEGFRYLVVHLWEEGSMELVAAAVIAATLARVLDVPWHWIEPWLWVESALFFLSGTFGIAHHYYWFGTIPALRLVGAVFSLLQLLPIGVVAFESMLYSKGRVKAALSTPAVLLVWSSVFWNVVGAGTLGFIMSIPAINRYIHGSFMTSGHAHMALFGVLGMGTLGACAAALETPLPDWSRLRLAAIAILNLSLGIMGFSLVGAGIAEAYLLRVAGMDFGGVISLLHQYFTVRFIGGLMFMTGGVPLAFSLLHPYWKYIRRGEKA
jgi:nitric oxide reductase subunit B